MNAEIVTLVERLDGNEDARALVRAVLAYHRDALARIVDTLERTALADLVKDPLVKSLLDLHELAPPEPDASLVPATKLLSKVGAKKRRSHGDRAECELCGADAGVRHPHLVDLDAQLVRCACTGCALLMESDGSKLRRVPERVVRVSSLATADAAWRLLGVPVGVAFFVKSSRTDEVRAHYPGALGAVMSAVTPEAFAALEQAHPELRTMAPDVEALVVSRVEGAREHWITGVHRAYELAGRVRKKWKGFTGGAEVRKELSSFFGELEREACS